MNARPLPLPRPWGGRGRRGPGASKGPFPEPHGELLQLSSNIAITSTGSFCINVQTDNRCTKRRSASLGSTGEDGQRICRKLQGNSSVSSGKRFEAPPTGRSLHAAVGGHSLRRCCRCSHGHFPCAASAHWLPRMLLSGGSVPPHQRGAYVCVRLLHFNLTACDVPYSVTSSRVGGDFCPFLRTFLIRARVSKSGFVFHSR